MDRLIQAILALSRQGRRVLTPEHLPMDTIVGDIAKSLEMFAADRNARFMIETPLPDLHHDRLTIEQIFTNLMENAVKYLAPGRPGVISIRGTDRSAAARGSRSRIMAAASRPRITAACSTCSAARAARTSRAKASASPTSARSPIDLAATSPYAPTLSEGSTFIVELPVKSSAEGKPE